VFVRMKSALYSVSGAVGAANDPTIAERATKR
jgi:hypothetical protein